MDIIPGQQRVVKFGTFEVDLQSGELRKAGMRQRLAHQPFQVLQALLERPKEIVTREELRRRLWPDQSFGDYDLAIKKAVNRLRDALGDSAENPRFIETLPRHGYRFIGGVDAQISEPASLSTSGTSGRKMPWALLGSLSLAVLVALLFGLNVGKLRTRIFANARLSEIHSLAVLPLENLSKDPEQDYFAEGIADALTTDLAQIGSLRVISRTSAMYFKNAKKTLPEIGRDLQVDAIVEGTVSRSENRVRITAQLIEAASDRHLWAKSYERDLKDVLVLQDEVARDIAEEIRIKLTTKERTALAGAHPVNPDALDAYLKGRYWWSKRTAEGEWKGLNYFQQAVAKDPNYALAYAGIADSYVVLGHHGRLAPKEALPKAKMAALKAVELDPLLPEAHTSLAIIRLAYDWDWSGAESEFRQALSLNPNYATTHHWYSHHLVAMGRLDEALNELERARELDPFSMPINDFLGTTLYYARRYDDAIRQLRRALEMHPEATEIHEQLADIYEQKNMLPEAFAERLQSVKAKGDTKLAAALDQAYKRFGYKGFLHSEIQSVEQASTSGPLPDLYLAHLYAILNDPIHALNYLERACSERNAWVLNVQVDPAMDQLRSSARFRDLLHRIGLPSP